MAVTSKYIFVVSMDVDPDKEALFNEVYDTEHVPALRTVPIGGETRKLNHDAPRYTAIYEIDGPHVLTSPEWAKAGEVGRWAKEVRPHTRNRRHAVYKAI